MKYFNFPLDEGDNKFVDIAMNTIMYFARLAWLAIILITIGFVITLALTNINYFFLLLAVITILTILYFGVVLKKGNWLLNSLFVVIVVVAMAF